MHCLEVIIARNERAAGREEAHAVNDGNLTLAQSICDTDARALGESHSAAHRAGYIAGRKEG